MSELLKQAIAVVANLDPNAQEDVAMAMLMMAKEHEHAMVELSPDEEAAILTSKAAVLRGEIATDEQVAALMTKYS